MREVLAWVCLVALAGIACTDELAASTPTPIVPSATVRPTATATLAPPTATPTPSIVVSTNVSTIYYEVYGLTTDEIFDSIEVNGPRLESDELGLGLASWKYTGLDWRLRPGLTSCGIGSASLTVDIVVTLPRLVSFEDVGTGLQRRWEKLEAEISAHEQRHVDIVLAGVESLKSKLETTEPQPSCPTLSSTIEAVWLEQVRLIDEGQEAFHSEERVRLESLRVPLQSQFDANTAQLQFLESQIASLDALLADNDATLQVNAMELERQEQEIDKITAAYPSNVLPPPVFDLYEVLVDSYNLNLAQFNALVEQYNATLANRSSVASQHEALRIETNQLADEIFWIQ